MTPCKLWYQCQAASTFTTSTSCPVCKVGQFQQELCLHFYACCSLPCMMLHSLACLGVCAPVKILAAFCFPSAYFSTDNTLQVNNADTSSHQASTKPFATGFAGCSTACPPTDSMIGVTELSLLTKFVTASICLCKSASGDANTLLSNVA